ncbi:papain like protease [Neolewinella xylanilytica]|uniref:Papain like protease n=1 Tax=Neolewinella xylanilytica TaxID=1514080 RepID=A0A2S6I9F0_9BACT|nr:C1 family peptidase [Neolewinella xylanilytica]PPK88099.1 papain like protease [Neolewinella xylanilytica]
MTILRQTAFLFALFLCSCALAQQPYGTAKSAEKLQGLSDLETIDQMMYYIPGIGSSSREDLLRQNIKPYMMPIRQVPQTGMEWAYALADALEYYVNLNSNFKDNMSPDYISMSLANAGTRPNLVDGLGLLMNAGTVSAAIVPYNSSTIPNSVYSVARFGIENFGYLFRPETKPRNRVFEARKALSRGNPVIVELSTDDRFTGLKSGTYEPDGPATEKHFMTVIGYDGEAETFELRSSLGRNWGAGGYVTISYEDFGELAQTGYVLIPKE